MADTRINFEVSVTDQQAETSLKKLETQFNSVTKNSDKLSESVKRSNTTLFALNQTTRDLPFGFLGISNNLPMLMDQFQKLKEETGGTRAAFSSLASSMVGPMGINLAISAGISLLTYWSMHTTKAKEKTEEFTLETIVAKTESEKFASSLSKVNSELLKLTNDQLVKKIAQLKDKITELTQESITKSAWQNTPLGALLIAVGAMDGVDSVIDKITKTIATLNEANKIQAGDTSILGKLNAQIEIVKKRQDEAKTTQELISANRELKRLEEERQRLMELGLNNQIKWRGSLPEANGLTDFRFKSGVLNQLGYMKIGEKPKAVQETEENLKKLQEHEAWLSKDFADSFGDALYYAGEGAFEKIFGKANSFAEIFLESFFNKFVNRETDSLSDWLFNSISDPMGGGGLLGGILGSLGLSKTNYPSSGNSQTILIQIGNDDIKKAMIVNTPSVNTKIARLQRVA